jgi:cystathionine gamma-synthase
MGPAGRDEVDPSEAGHDRGGRAVPRDDDLHFETRAIHAGQEPEPQHGSVNVPIFQTSTYAQLGVGKPRTYDYARGGNPTREALQAALASLEGGEYSYSFASGMAAETTLLLMLLRPGDHVVLGDDVYGGTYRLLARVLAEWGVAFDAVNLSDERALRGAIRDETRVVWVESPSNPLLKIVDIARCAEIARASGARCVVDNTFATPYLQRPLELGADVVVHSVTKYLAGHSDLVSGAVVVRDRDTAERLAFLQNAVGAVPGPLDCYLALRGLKTLAIRMQAHCRGARAVAAFLDGHPRVSRVYYPGLPSHPGHDVAREQMRDFGGMVSFEVGSEADAIDVAQRTKLFFLAESLGGVESLIEVPGPMTHASVAGSELEVPPTLIRLSVGVEHPDDLVADLEQALG